MDIMMGCELRDYFCPIYLVNQVFKNNQQGFG